MHTILIALAFLSLYMSVLFIVGIVLKNNGVADIGYGVAFMVVVGMVSLLESASSWHVILLAALPFAWGTRLALRIYMKNRGKPEDFRYRTWRESWGKTFYVRSFFQIFMLQGAIVFLISLPLVLSFVYAVNLRIASVFYLGVVLWLIGFAFETIGDFELDRFLNNPENKGKIMTSGLWAYTRHPNYFGESLMWWGIALASTMLTSQWILVFVSPILITYLLLKVSGVPMLEKKWEGNLEWEAYKSRTSVFFPLPPKTSI